MISNDINFVIDYYNNPIKNISNAEAGNTSLYLNDVCVCITKMNGLKVFARSIPRYITATLRPMPLHRLGKARPGA